jgi:hypothetical protein
MRRAVVITVATRPYFGQEPSEEGVPVIVGRFWSVEDKLYFDGVEVSNPYLETRLNASVWTASGSYSLGTQGGTLTLCDIPLPASAYSRSP